MSEETLQEETTHQENEVESRAKRLGWVPKDEFKGDPERHRSAEEFLERGQNLLPILQRDNERLHRTVDRLEKRMTEQLAVFSEFQQHSEKAEERAYKRAKAELEAKRDAAIQSADVDGARQAQRELDALTEDKPAPKPEARREEKPAVDPVFASWMDENPWFNKDPELHGAAVKIYGVLEREKPGVAAAELLAETRRRIVAKFPEEFGINPRREGAASVAEPNGGTAPPKKKGKTYEDLPADAKKACDRFVKTIPGYTREKYVKDYEWE